jgi:hypothetical protein
MRCVKDCYFLSYIRMENKIGELLYKGYYCELYDKRLKREIKTNEKTSNGTLFEIIRCEECENHETMYYNDKMKRMI